VISSCYLGPKTCAPTPPASRYQPSRGSLTRPSRPTARRWAVSTVVRPRWAAFRPMCRRSRLDKLRQPHRLRRRPQRLDGPEAPSSRPRAGGTGDHRRAKSREATPMVGTRHLGQPAQLLLHVDRLSVAFSPRTPRGFSRRHLYGDGWPFMIDAAPARLECWQGSRRFRASRQALKLP
jgi:hypothetical protein